MKYDFTTVWEREGKDAIAVDNLGTAPGFAPEKPKDGFDEIPMWVADMNFATAPSITKAMQERIEHPLFGYFSDSDAYFDSIIRWQEKRNHVKGLHADHIGYENGVLGGVATVLNTLSAPGDSILLHSPTYVGFTKTLTNNGRKIVHSPLVLDTDGIWRMDYADMDRKLKEEKIHLAIFCSPHNPLGRVWEKEEIEKAMEIYRANDCYVISDEIWSDLLLNGASHIPTQSISEDAKMRTISLYAPSKTFNLAGLTGSYHIIYNKYLKDRIDAVSMKTHYNAMNVLSMHALIGAYSDIGEEWLEELLTVLNKNSAYVYQHIQENYPGISVAKPEGTYMLFLDCSAYCKEKNLSLDAVLKAGWDVGVGWQDGRPFQGDYGIRLNLASPYSRIKEAMDRLDRYVFVCGNLEEK